MGILNLTPDSFSDGGKFNSPDRALQRAEEILQAGAEIIDIGAQSTRPNATFISALEEIKRIGSTVSEIKKRFPECFISLDTFYPEVVRFGFEQGIDLVNDISGGQYFGDMFETVAATGLPYILMHVSNKYDEMHSKTIGEDILLVLNNFFSEKILELKSNGVKDIILDPGFGFGKTIGQNHQLADEFQHIGFSEYPVLAGISRKSFIYKPLGKGPMDIAAETAMLHRKLLLKGAKVLRVHDVADAKKILDESLV